MGHSMVNKFGGKCDRCGKRVAAGEGFLSFVDKNGPNWNRPSGLDPDIALLEHAACKQKYAGTNIHHYHNPDVGNG